MITFFYATLCGASFMVREQKREEKQWKNDHPSHTSMPTFAHEAENRHTNTSANNRNGRSADTTGEKGVSQKDKLTKTIEEFCLLLSDCDGSFSLLITKLSEINDVLEEKKIETGEYIQSLMHVLAFYGKIKEEKKKKEIFCYDLTIFNFEDIYLSYDKIIEKNVELKDLGLSELTIAIQKAALDLLVNLKN